MKTDYKKYIISKGGNELGILWTDIKYYLLTPDQYKKFSDFMEGQTCCVLEHQSDDGKQVQMLPLVYVDDLVRFVEGRKHIG